LFAGWPSVLSGTRSSRESAVGATIACTAFPCQQFDCSINQNFVDIAKQDSEKIDAESLQIQGFSEIRARLAQCATAWKELGGAKRIGVGGGLPRRSSRLRSDEHEALLQKLVENGGNVPRELMD
jgi:hypothetical protein